jgi:uncharacterized membrane protein
VQGGKEEIEGRQEHIIGALLRAGVVIAAIVVLAGGVMYLVQHGAERPDYHTFRGEADNLRSVGGVLRDAFARHGDGIIQLGLLLLILTPITRVALSAVSFAIEGDRMYVGITLIVLAVLVFSLVAIR